MAINEKMKWPTDKTRYDKNWSRIFGILCKHCRGKGCPTCDWLGSIERKKRNE